MSRQLTEATRRKMSESAKARCTSEWRRERSERLSTPLDTEKVRTMYESGMTQHEIAVALGVSQKVIWTHMKNHAIKARIAAKRNQSGDNNHMWKGEGATYKAFHLRIYNKYGKASNYGCSVCGRKDNDTWYDWANLTGDYGNVNDYAPMCRSCHRKYDRERRCANA